MVKRRDKLRRQMRARGWTLQQVDEARTGGLGRAVVNRETGGAATRYIHPTTGRSVEIDDASGDVSHVGGDGFIY